MERPPYTGAVEQHPQAQLRGRPVWGRTRRSRQICAAFRAAEGSSKFLPGGGRSPADYVCWGNRQNEVEYLKIMAASRI